MGLTGNKKITNLPVKQNHFLSFVLLLIISGLNIVSTNAQVTGIASGATFNWQAPQNSVNDPAVLESIVINGRVYNTFVVPSSYDLVRLGPGGHNANTIFQDGTQIVSSSSNTNWDSEALNAFQSLNLNHYFQSNGNGRNICGDQNALATTDAQIQSIYYNPGIPSNQNGVLAVTERNANNCIHISVYGYPSGGNTIEELGATFILPNSAQSGPHNNEPPSNGSDYWLTNKVNQNNGTIGIALFELSQLAPVGSTITEVRFTAATVDVADGKFFIMQEYAVDDIFDTEFNTAFNGDVGANDNVPDNSAYTYLPSVDPINGSVVVNLDGTFTYTPNPGFVGTDVFEVQVCLPAPNQAVCNTSSVTLTVNADNLPTAVDDSYTIQEDQVNNVFNVLANDDFGLDGPATSNALMITNNPTNGTATINNNGTPSNQLDDFINYTPNPYFNGSDSFIYQITDGNGTVTSATVNITVNDGNKNITLTNTNTTVSEGSGVALVTITIYGNYQVPPTITYSTSDNTANSGQDYTAISNNHTFLGNDGEEFEISIPIIDDLIIENTELFNISVSSSSYNSPVNLNSVVSILDNDGNAANGISVSDFNVNEDAGTANFTVTLNANVQGGFNVDYAITDGTATAGDDYTVASATGNIAFTGNAGEQHNVSVAILDDALIESTEDLSFALSNLSTNLINIIDGAATGTINDNDGNAANGISVSDFNVNEDAGTANFTVTLNANVQGGFNVDYAITDGSATAGDDYTVASATGNIAFTGNAGEQHNVSVAILDDALIESTEDLSFALSNLSTNLINIIDGAATGTINDNDGNASNGISVSDFNVNEDAGTANFTVTLNANVQGGFNVDYAITDGSATAGDDYTVASATGNIAFTGNAGEQHNVSVAILDDALIESTEDLSFALSNLSTNLINIIDGAATGTINDNDGNAANGVQFDVTNIDIDEDAGTVSVGVSLNVDVQNEFTVSFYTTDGTATNALDYIGIPRNTQTLTFGGTNNNNQTITVSIIDDIIIENSENFQVILTDISTNLVNILSNDTATVNIIDNDGNEGYPIDITIEACDVILAAEVITVTSTCASTVDFVEAISGQNDGCAAEYTITRTWTFTDCVSNVREHVQVITIEDTQAPIFVETLPADTTVSCDNVPTASILTASDSCDTNVAVIFDELITDTDSCGSNYIITRTWSASDCAGNPVSHTQVITVEDTTAPTFVEVLPTDTTVSCDNVPTATILTATDNCDPNVAVVFNEQITDNDSCGSNYTITRTWSASDCAGNPVNHTQIITVEDTTAPTFVEVLPMDVTVSCDNVPTAAILTAADNCDTNITVLLDEQITDMDSCGSNYTITRTWSMSDCAGNPTTHTQVITVEDTTAPTFVEALPQSAIVSCNMIPEAVTLTAVDNCDADVTLNFEETITNDSNCATGYTVTRVWTATDCAGNPTTHTQILTVEPTGPITASPYDDEITIICGDEIPIVPALEFMGGCGDYQVEFNEETSSTNDTDDYMIVRTWDVTDSCGNTASFEQIIFVMQPQLEEIFIEICVEDEPIDLINYLPESFDTNGTFEIISGNTNIMGSTFTPENLEVGEYLIAYSSTEGTCKYYADFTITVNSDCVPCGRDEIIVSTAVTANGDNINDLFTITGVEYCNYSFELMIFNRWGDKVYESMDYQNDWGGFAPNNSFGNAGMLPSGTYYYIINIKNQDIKPLNGYIYIGAN
ncbi:Calx-beta domain-containing protein [Flagellimonas sp. CMM7]|uniref:Calx-beta domain-containing protein n=1 Tax=Flagellimonas sp. CMM7 TaxID=2654676 RepID=UPI001F3A8803|nr:Calx-beta domain-containing protein [Flagellimonas sp. CMM7]UII80576.1 Ig-like domain-containing protein [Flagellimonas sp. CMM7]